MASCTRILALTQKRDTRGYKPASRLSLETRASRIDFMTARPWAPSSTSTITIPSGYRRCTTRFRQCRGIRPRRSAIRGVGKFAAVRATLDFLFERLQRKLGGDAALGSRSEVLRPKEGKDRDQARRPRCRDIRMLVRPDYLCVARKDEGNADCRCENPKPIAQVLTQPRRCLILCRLFRR
jgi:hypothetical protein